MMKLMTRHGYLLQVRACVYACECVRMVVVSNDI